MRDKREKGWFWAENEIIDCDYLKPMERLLYLVLARHSDNKTDESFPSIETLCKKTGVKDKRTIVPYIKNLENLGLISVVRTKGMPNKYYLKNVPKELDTKNVPSTKIDTTLDTKNVPRVGTKNVPLTILSKKTNKKDLYTEIFNHYLSKENLIKHTKFTEPMKKGIDKVIKIYGLDLDYIKRIIDRHSEKVEQDKHKTEFKTATRTLSELLGQKKFRSEDYICSDYFDEKYIKESEPKKINESIKQEEFKSEWI